MELTWNDATLQRFTGNHVPKNTVVRQKELTWLLDFIHSCCPVCYEKAQLEKLYNISRVVHMAAFPGSGKTLLLQQLKAMYSARPSKRTKSASNQRMEDSNSDKDDRNKTEVCPHSRVLFVSCASKSWEELFQRIMSEFEATSRKKVKSSMSRPKQKGNIGSVRKSFVKALQSFKGIIVLDEIDTVVNQKSSRGSKPFQDTKTISAHPKSIKSKCPARTTDEEFGFLIDAFNSCSSAGLVLISNHMNIHAQKMIETSIDKNAVNQIILEAYSKHDIRAILESRCEPEKVFDPAAIELLVNTSNDARRVLSIALDAMLYARKQYRCTIEPQTATRYPCVSVKDIAQCCAGSGDVMLRQLRTVLSPLSNDLQLLLTGIVHLSKKAIESSASKDSAVPMAMLYRWVFNEGLVLTRMGEIYDDSSFRRGIKSLVDFNLIKHRCDGMVQGTSHATKKSAASASALIQYKGILSLQYDLHAIKLAIQGLLREGVSGKEAFHATSHLL